MSKKIFLVRHAEAANKAVHEADKDRKLTPKGRQQALTAGTSLLHKNLLPEVIFASTAERARETTIILANAIKFSPEKILFKDGLYEAGLQTFFTLIENMDSKNSSIMFVGHNPVISLLLRKLSPEAGDMPTAGTGIISFDVSFWSEISGNSGELIHYINPGLP